jgi:hypothetical protein
MSRRSPRHQKKEEQAVVVESNGRPLNGHAKGPAQPEQQVDQTDENIFLFIPNLIGMYPATEGLYPIL